jgi:hypothetical protein
LTFTQRANTQVLIFREGHYSYECTSAKQERPYVSRPSRTQQLHNPKLAPKLSAAPKPPIGVKDDHDEKSTAELDARGRSRDTRRPQESYLRRRQSTASYSSRSVSTISTNASRSRSPDARQRRPTKPDREGSNRRRRTRSYSSSRLRSISRSPVAREERHSARADHTEARRSRSPRRDRRARSRSSTHSPPARSTQARNNNAYRERSMSPYSRRVALSGAAGGG